MPSAPQTAPTARSATVPGMVPTSSARVFRAGNPFTAAELQSMALDGLLTHVFGSTYVRPGTRAVPALRAGAMADAVSAGLLKKGVIGRQSAAWIYGCAPAPARINLLIDRNRRTTSVGPFSGNLIHEVHLPASDTLTLSNTIVTTPIRTARDLALYSPEAQAAPWIKALTANSALVCTLDDVKQALEVLVRVPRKRAALTLVHELMEEAGKASCGVGNP
ncbi:type IV toxin-antitoxin system AbiEi family antitoxin [Arthrobacter monumenti]